MLGDPDCPYCHGAGYLRTDVPVGHPNFGRLEICVCRQRDVSQQVRERLYSLSRLDELKGLTFDSFQPRGHKGPGKMQADSLEMAFNQAQHYAKNLNGWLFLQGGYGCGKTHLAAAIANYAVEMGVPTLFLTVPDLLDMLRFSYDSEDTTFEERFNEIRNASLLVLDDFGTQNATGWAQEKLFQILNYRYINKLPLVITTNLSLDEIDGRIRSRLQDPELVSLTKILAPDYRRPADEIGHLELSSLAHLKNRKFINFELREKEGLPNDVVKDLKEAFDAARYYADNPDGWIAFVGLPGSGKTHLAAAIGNYRAELGNPPLFIVTPDLLDYLRATFSPDSSIRYDRRFEEIKTTPLLILDDLGAQSQTAWAKEKLFQILNHRYNTELPTVITMSLDAMKDIDPRIQIRLADSRICEYYTITAPAYRHPESKKEARKQKPRRNKGR
jgi:DNA replication protein DnaC